MLRQQHWEEINKSHGKKGENKKTGIECRLPKWSNIMSQRLGVDKEKSRTKSISINSGNTQSPRNYVFVYKRSVICTSRGLRHCDGLKRHCELRRGWGGGGVLCSWGFDQRQKPLSMQIETLGYIKWVNHTRRCSGSTSQDPDNLCCNN